MKKLLYSIALFFLPHPSFPQTTSGLVLTQITEENGLSDNHVQSILKDSEGYVWIGTSDGLNLLDGSTVQAFRHSETDSTSLFNNNVLSLTEDAEKNIWVATAMGISGYQKRGKKFFNAGLPFSVYGASNIVRTVIADKQNRLWCATDGGLFVYNIQTKIATAYYNTTPGENFTSVNKLVCAVTDRSGKLWLCTFDGLWTFDTKTLHFKRVVGTSNDANYEGLTTSVFEDGENRLWFGNWSAGLKLLDRASGAVTSFTALRGAITHVASINEMNLPGGRGVICLNGSLICFDPETKDFFHLPKPSGLTTYPLIKKFYQSADGWIWMCSDNGLWIYNPRRQFFRHHFFSQAITSQSVSLLDWNGELLVGGEGKDFLAAYDDDFQVTKRFAGLHKTASGNSENRSTLSTLCFVKESERDLLITNSEGILRYTVQTGGRQWLLHGSKDNASLPTGFIQHLFIDSKKRCWVFPWRSGIYNMNPAKGECHLVYKGFLPQGTGIKGLVIADAAEDGQGNIWMADLDEGIVLFDGAANKFSKPFEKLIGGRSRSARVIYRNGFCYAFADDRLLKWDTETKLLEIIKAPPQMQSDIYDMALDANGYCWLATKKGLLLYTGSRTGFKQFTTADGLLNNDMDGNLYLRENGRLVFATPAALTQFSPQNLLQSSVAPANILLTGFDVNGENIAYDSAQTTHLNYTQNNLFFHWTVTDYTAPFRNQYWCRLQGIDAGWKYVGNKGEMQYANLSPGPYTLLLKGATANGGAAGKSIAIHFKITPPFWKTAWFWAMWIALAGLGIYWYVNRQIKSIKAKAAMDRQITELELKALKAQMNPHFIFNSLSSIQESIVSGNTEAASKYLGKFSKLIRAVLENSDKKLITLPQEVDYLKLYLELESFRFGDFSFSLDAKDIDDAAFIKIPPMLVQPYVENAIKHGLSHKEGLKKVRVLFKLAETAFLQVTVEDNGIGRQQAALINQSRIASHQSLGMRITEERLGLHSGQEHRVEIVDLINEKGDAAGTRIIIYVAIEN